MAGSTRRGVFEQRSLVIRGFHRVFTEFYHVLPNQTKFTEFYRILSSFATSFYNYSLYFTEFYQVLAILVKLNRVLPSFT